MRLLEETTYLPDLTLGLRDLVGTGLDGAEYLVASKRVGNFDITAGLGWGRLGSSGALKNPFGLISSSFNSRSGDAAATAGDINFGQYFHGPDAGIFGGVTWQTPFDKLELLVEYSSDRYVRETNAGILNLRSPLNAGLAYRPFDGVTLSAGWLYGTTFSLALTLSVDPTRTSFDTRTGTPPPAPSIRPPEERRLASAALLDLIETGPIQEKWRRPTPFALLLPRI